MAIATFFMDAVFPRQCVSCAAEGRLLCSACRSAWNPNIPMAGEQHLWSFSYADPIARELICAWKYDFDGTARDHLFEALSRRLHALAHLVEARNIQAICPVPLHARRACERGFDQAREIADFLCGHFGIRRLDALTRTRATGKQAEREASEREREMTRNPFEAARVLPNRLLLVDDVWTTGSTAQAARRALLANGAVEVWVYTLAKG